MKTIFLRISIFLFLTISSCSKETCKTCSFTTSYDGIIQDELNWTAEYCNEELESIENSNPIVSDYSNYTSIIEINCE